MSRKVIVRRKMLSCIVIECKLNYQCQRKNDRDQGHFSIFMQGVYKHVWARIIHLA